MVTITHSDTSSSPAIVSVTQLVVVASHLVVPCVARGGASCCNAALIWLKSNAIHRALLTYLVEPYEPALDGMPLLKAAAGHWTGRSRRWSSLPHLQFILVTSRDIGDVAQHA